jgi:hypothetical protein
LLIAIAIAGNDGRASWPPRVALVLVGRIAT